MYSIDMSRDISTAEIVIVTKSIELHEKQDSNRLQLQFVSMKSIKYNFVINLVGEYAPVRASCIFLRLPMEKYQNINSDNLHILLNVCCIDRSPIDAMKSKTLSTAPPTKRRRNKNYENEV